MSEKIRALRTELDRRNLTGFILPKTDEYQNEYSAAYAERLAWLSDFTGSAGLIIVCADSAALFVDGRYTLQARDQVDTSIFEVSDLSNDAMVRWLKSHLKDGDRLGYDPELHTLSSLAIFREACSQLEVELVALKENPVDPCWQDQPNKPISHVMEQPLNYAGEASQRKCERLSEQLREQRADAVVITMPDCIAWLLNVRAGDIPHVPVALSWAILYANGAVDWFIDSNRVNFSDSEEDREHINILAESAFQDRLIKLASGGGKVILDDTMSSLSVRDLLVSQGAELIHGNPVFAEKACKNASELDGARNAHRRDGVALANFLAWFDRSASSGELMELDIVEKLLSLRQQQDFFQETSFDTISGAGSHGAIVHYRVNENSNKRLENDSIFLVDSGAQYLDGTTDVTRTLAIGNVTAEQKEHFTRVLKGHIALATCRFPEGTSGHQLDCLARHSLWQIGLDYGHGTGHGVGSYLAVHEGPQRIAPWPNSVALKPGMILSNEPGYYQEGEYGIRIENLIAVTQSKEYTGFLEFETLTLAPIERKLIKPALLSEAEIAWFDDYHQRVYETLQSRVSDEIQQWLSQATQPLCIQ